MYKIFIQALSFNISAAFIYKIALLTHQIFLYSIISHNLYGQQSSLFAAVYLLIALTNFGFDETLLPFFSIYTHNKKQFNTLLHYFYLHVITLCIITCFIVLAMAYNNGVLLHTLGIQYNKNIILVLPLLFLIESIKKSVIAMMQLAFLNKAIAFIQLSMLITYIASIWIIYAYFKQVTLSNIFIPMLITSFLELFYLLYNFKKFYQRLGSKKSALHIPFKVLFAQRIFNYMNQLAKTIYNPNSIMLFFVYTLGFTQAATIKLFTNIITLFYTCIAKSLGVTVGAIFSLQDTKSANIALFFKNITYRYFQLLSIFALVMFTVITYAYKTDLITQNMAYQILFFLSISCIDTMSITYEQFLLSQKNAGYVLFINSLLLCILILFVIGRYHSNYHINFIFLSIGVKLISLYAMHKTIQNSFNI